MKRTLEHQDFTLVVYTPHPFWGQRGKTQTELDLACRYVEDEGSVLSVDDRVDPLIVLAEERIKVSTLKNGKTVWLLPQPAPEGKDWYEVAARAQDILAARLFYRPISAAIHTTFARRRVDLGYRLVKNEASLETFFREAIVTLSASFVPVLREYECEHVVRTMLATAKELN